jgi:hypothetical protein
MLLGFMRTDIDDQNAGRSQEMHQPFQRGFQCSGRVPRPVNQRNVVLTARNATRGRCGEAAVSSAVQLKHTLGRLRSGQDDPMKLGTTGKLDHHFDASISRPCGVGIIHDHHSLALGNVEGRKRQSYAARRPKQAQRSRPLAAALLVLSEYQSPHKMRQTSDLLFQQNFVISVGCQCASFDSSNLEIATYVNNTPMTR